MRREHYFASVRVLLFAVARREGFRGVNFRVTFVRSPFFVTFAAIVAPDP
jgi:hypothetical protein